MLMFKWNETWNVVLKIKVDGEDLGYESKNFGKGKTSTLGLWSFNTTTRQSGHTALRFYGKGGNINYNSDIGTVELSFYKYIQLQGTYDQKDFSSKLAETPPRYIKPIREKTKIEP